MPPECCQSRRTRRWRDLTECSQLRVPCKRTGVASFSTGGATSEESFWNTGTRESERIDSSVAEVSCIDCPSAASAVQETKRDRPWLMTLMWDEPILVVPEWILKAPKPQSCQQSVWFCRSSSPTPRSRLVHPWQGQFQDEEEAQQTKRITAFAVVARALCIPMTALSCVARLKPPHHPGEGETANSHEVPLPRCIQVSLSSKFRAASKNSRIREDWFCGDPVVIPESGREPSILRIYI